MMKLNDFISKLQLALEEPSRYEKSGWGKWNGTTWGWDCVCLVKGILWGWDNDKSKPRGGGAVYGSNGVPDLGDNSMYNACLKKSSDFSKISKGELVWMSGHVGVYVGNGNVIEATMGFNQNGVIKSQIDSKGNRTYKGQGGSPKWSGHGFLPYVDYKQEEDYFVPNKSYKLLYDKYLRISPNMGNNILPWFRLDDWSKNNTCQKKNGNAQLKKGVVIEPEKIVKQTDGRIYASYGNCWWCCQNIKGEKQAIKVN